MRQQHHAYWSRQGRQRGVGDYTLNDWFGAKVTAAKTGVLLNDEMDDFTARSAAEPLWPGAGEANAINPENVACPR